jgi:ribose 5-phosphate isomerase B
MRIAIGSDHAGYDLKEKLLGYIEELNHEIHDFGTDGTESVDYPDFAFKVGEAVARGDFDFGLLVCSTGVGMCVAANKVKGIRAALVCDSATAVQSRAHVNCNVLVFGQKASEFETARSAFDAWMKTPFEGGRHERRVAKITDYEKG